MKFLKCFLLVVVFVSCTENEINLDDGKTNLRFNFSHDWDGAPIATADLNDIKFTNENGEKLSIERLRYLISNIVLEKENGQKIILKAHHLADISKSESLQYQSLIKVSKGRYKVSFTFGFSSEDNVEGVYPDLNSVSWNVPKMLGGGYHFMQFDGKFLDATNAEANFNYHVIRAADKSDPTNLKLQDTSFTVDLGTLIISDEQPIEVAMDVSEWFKNPNLWDLNTLNTVLMPNFNAQIQMSENGKSVFRVVPQSIP